MAFKFIHTADIHLDSPLHRLEAYEGAPVEEIRQASRRAFENLIDLAIDEAVDFVLIAGDLFDGDWKDYNTGLYFIKQVRRLGEARIQVFIISGNHDAAGKMTKTLPYPDNVHVFSTRKPETKTLENPKVAVHGQSYSRVAVTDNIAREYPEPIPGYFNIGLLHTSLTGRVGHENYAPCSLDDLVNKGYDYWALGHVHQFELVAKDPPVVFPGCIQGRHIRESGAKGCVLVTAEGGTLPAVNRFDIDLIRWERMNIDLEGVRSIDEVLERFQAVLGAEIHRQDPKLVIARVVFTGETDLHAQIAADPELIKESVRSTAIANFGDRAWIEKVKVRTKPLSRSVADPGPLRELGLLVDDLTSKDSDLLALGKELSTLFQKLPPDYRQGDSRIQPDDPDQMRELVEKAQALLVSKLMQEAALS
ncbi:MAG: DNA repair exonuclease [Deltaproteobacteria bacterium]|nr:DNA repair exonuclease [Deltaproteobacteria bacterium]